MARPRSRRNVVSLASAYDDANTHDEMIEFTLPEDLASVDDETLDGLLGQAQEAFDALDGDSINADTVETMTKLADAAEAIRTEQTRREEEAAAARAAADDLRARMQPAPVAEPEAQADDVPQDVITDETVAEIDEIEVADEEAVAVAASSKEPLTIKLPAPRRRIEPVVTQKPGLTLVAAADLPGVPTGSTITLSEAAKAFVDRARSVNPSAMRAAARQGKRTVQSFSLGSYQKQFPEDLIVKAGSDPDEVLKRAADASRLPGGSLVASGAGWCSPSETLYQLAEDAETTDGLFSLPEVQVDRGGLRHTLGPDFSSIFTEDAISWNFSETEVEEGDYDGYGGGSKPCYFVECPEFVEDRLDVAGVCIRAGLLMDRAYPEVVERLVSGALVAHEFKQARRKLDTIIAGSTAVTMPSDPVGATAPILSAIELQVEDYKQRHRVGRGRSLEAVFPYWVRGAIRADLSRRLGVDMLAISNEQISGFFAQRGVNAQFVYELDDLTGAASARTAFPDDFKFLLYLEGTWIGGTQSVITLESVFDSALVEQNIFTQLFTEEGWLVAKRFHDSRVVTVPICPSGHVAGGVAVECDGSEGEAA